MGRISKEEEAILRPILFADDTEKFKEKMEELRLRGLTFPDVLKECYSNGGKKCALVLLRGELGGERPYASIEPLIFDLALDDNVCEPEIVRLLLEECEAHGCANKLINGFLPIHTFLEATTSKFPLSKWPRDASLITLIISLCHPSLKKRLEIAKLLAEHTDSLTDVAIGFLSNGDVAELGALLLVAHQTILEPLKSAPRIKVEGVDDLVSQTIHGNLTNPAGYGLINIFDKAGDALSQYWSSMEEDVSPVDVITKVAALIRDAGVPIIRKDVDFYDSLLLEHDVMDSINESLGFKKDDGVGNKQEPLYLSVRSARYKIAGDLFVPSTMGDGWSTFNNTVYNRLFNTSAERMYSTTAAQAQAHKMSRPFPSRGVGRMPFMAMRLVRALKYI